MSKIFICADTFVDAEICAYSKLNFPTTLNWIYVIDESAIKNISNATLYLYEDWYKKIRNVAKFLSYAQSQNFTIIKLP